MCTKADEQTQAVDSLDSTWGRRLVIIAIVGLLLVVDVYFWGNRLAASMEPSLSQAPQYMSLSGVAAVRAMDASLQ